MGKKSKYRLTVFVLVLSMVLIISLSGCSKPSETEQTEKWPTKPITLVIAYSAGGTTDTICRGLAREMQEYLGQEITCINVTGASGSVAGKQVIEAPADGYHIFGGVAHSASGWRILNYADIGWEDFYGFHAVTAPYVLFVSGDSKWESVDDLVAAMKANPGQIKWGSAGLGSMNHVTGTTLLDLLGVEATHIPYKGGREAAVKLMAGEVDFSWAGLSDVMDLAKSGKVRIIGIADDKDMKIEGEVSYVVPSLTKKWPELKAVEDLLYWGIQVRRETPGYIVKKLEEAFKYALEQERFKELCASRNLTIKPYTGLEDDKLCARLESIYAWGLVKAGLAAEGVSPADFDIPRITEYKWPPHERAKNAPKWPD